MDQTILDQLSFGFEIEGVFKEGINKSLDFKGRFVSDGSVRVNPEWEAQKIPVYVDCRNCIRDSGDRIQQYCPEHHAVYHREGTVSSEYATDVFQDFPACLEALKKFTKKNHIWNETCGLHFHVGLKGSTDLNKHYRKLFAIACNKSYIEELAKEALTWCDCQKSRLGNTDRSRFYLPYGSAREMISASKGSHVKYRFVNFHPRYKTLEFRFLCPCEHKAANVVKLMNSLTGYLARKESVHRYTVATVSKKEEPHIMNMLASLKIEAPLNIVKKLIPGKTAAIRRSMHNWKPKFSYQVNYKSVSQRERELAEDIGQDGSLIRAVDNEAYNAQALQRQVTTATAARLFNRAPIFTTGGEF